MACPQRLALLPLLQSSGEQTGPAGTDGWRQAGRTGLPSAGAQADTGPEGPAGAQATADTIGWVTLHLGDPVGLEAGDPVPCSYSKF